MVCLLRLVSILPTVPVQCDGEGVTWEGGRRVREGGGRKGRE